MAAFYTLMFAVPIFIIALAVVLSYRIKLRDNG